MSDWDCVRSLWSNDYKAVFSVVPDSMPGLAADYWLHVHDTAAVQVGGARRRSGPRCHGVEMGHPSPSIYRGSRELAP